MLARYMLSSCVCLSVCHKSVLSTRLNVGSCKLRRGTVYSFLTQHISATLQPMSSRATTASNANEMGYNRRPSTKSVRHLTNISLNVINGARQRYSYYGRLIGNRMHAIKWRYFQWPSVMPNHPKLPQTNIPPKYPPLTQRVISCSGSLAYTHMSTHTYIQTHTRAHIHTDTQAGTHQLRSSHLYRERIFISIQITKALRMVRVNDDHTVLPAVHTFIHE